MITQLCRGYHMRAVMILWCLTHSYAAYAWQQEYIAEDAQSATLARYTWDSDRQPRYEDILAERIQSQENSLVTVNSSQPWEVSVGWRLPMMGGINAWPGPARPWVKISYSQLPGEGDQGSYLTPVGAQYGNRVDVSVGADMQINKYLAAWTSLSQSEGGTDSGEVYIYNIGVSAQF